MDFSEGERELPPGWATIALRDLLHGRGESLDPSRHPEQEFTLYSVPAYENARPERVRGSEIGSTKQRVMADTVLLCKINPRINRVWRVRQPHDGTPLIASTEWIAFPPYPGVTPDFLRLFLTRETIRQYLAANASGVGGSLMRVNATVAGGIEMPLPPLPEQARIVAAVNGLFEEVEAGEAALARARAGLETFRASLLHAACTGALTAPWRQANPTNETGADLLRSILDDRRADWPGRYVVPVTPRSDGLPALPDRWCWASLDQLAVAPARNGISVKGSPEPPGVPALRLDAMQGDKLDFSRRRYIQIASSKANDLAIRDGDFLISRANGSLALMGRACVAHSPAEPTVFPDTMIRFRLSSRVAARWIGLAWRSAAVRSHLEARAKTSAGIWKISQDDMRSAPIPLPPLREMVAVLEAWDQALADDADLPADGFATQLRQSILHAAFTGRLVPQDPSDEPASELLDRLRGSAVTAPRRGRRARAQHPSLIEASP